MIVNQRSIYFFRLLSDLLLLNCVFLLSAIYAQSWSILIERDYMFFLLIGLNLLWIVTSNYFNFYDDFFSRNFPVQFANLLRNTVLQIVATIFFIFLLKEDLFTRNFIGYFSILLVLLVSIRIIIFRKVLKFLRRKGKNVRNMMIVGEGELAQNFKAMVISNPDFGYNFKGFISNGDDNVKGATENLVRKLEQILTTTELDDIVIAVSEGSRHLLERIIKACDKQAVKVHIIPDYYNLVSKRFQLSSFGEFPIITSRREPLEEVQWRIVKRSFDIIFSLLVIIFILSWVYLLVLILTRILDRGPVLFVQERIGAKNKKFKCYKFRTMKYEKAPVDEFKPVTENDPRITKMGKLLRRSNLDELPQFINVLMANMSVVGPRPHAISYESIYSKVVDEIRLRHNVKPGITGWAQIHGLRGDVTDEETNRDRTRKRIEYDLWYIENWSFTLDLQIILNTILKMLSGKSRGV